MEKDLWSTLNTKIYPKCNLIDFLDIQKDAKDFIEGYAKRAEDKMNKALDEIKPINSIWLIVDGLEIEVYADTEIKIEVREPE